LAKCPSYLILIPKDPIFVYPTAHFQNGGIVIRPDGSAKGLPNLYAAGGVTGGVHGRNRLAGNSLLEIVVFGRRAGKAAALRAKEVTPGKLTLDHVARFNRACQMADLPQDTLSPMLLPDYTRAVR